MNSPHYESIKLRPILEVIACSVADAVAAERGGADRLEVISNFDKGGFTPPLELVRQILDSVSLPLRVMARESEDFTVSDKSEIDSLCQSARDLSELPINGLVLGFTRDNAIDVELTSRVLSFAPKLRATFHHAFEAISDPMQAIAQIKSIGQIDRILTYGGKGDWETKVKALSDYHRAACPEITILPAAD